MNEKLKPIEENRFIIADYSIDRIEFKFFRFNYYRQSAEDIDAL